MFWRENKIMKERKDGKNEDIWKNWYHELNEGNQLNCFHQFIFSLPLFEICILIDSDLYTAFTAYRDPPQYPLLSLSLNFEIKRKLRL